MTNLNLHIPTVEIEQDIADTKQEIALLRGEIAALEATPQGSADFKMAHFRASGKRNGIKERETFIAKLREILDERAKTPNDGGKRHE